MANSKHSDEINFTPQKDAFRSRFPGLRFISLHWPWQKCIDLSFGGAGAMLIEAGFLNQSMIELIPPCGVKHFHGGEELGIDCSVHRRRGGDFRVRANFDLDDWHPNAICLRNVFGIRREKKPDAREIIKSNIEHAVDCFRVARETLCKNLARELGSYRVADADYKRIETIVATFESRLTDAIRDIAIAPSGAARTAPQLHLVVSNGL